MVTVIDQALADMRDGLGVLVIASTAPAADDAFKEAARGLVRGERAHRGAGHIRIDRTGGGWIVFRGYSTITRGGGRGLSVDRVLFDHRDLYEQIAPMFVTARAGFQVEHYPSGAQC